jgi:hypothetical protein
MTESVTLIRDGVKRTVKPHVAAEMMKRHGWMRLPEPPKADPDGKTLAQLKKEIREADSAEDVAKALEAERAGANRKSVIDLCEQRLSEL